MTTTSDPHEPDLYLLIRIVQNDDTTAVAVLDNEIPVLVHGLTGTSPGAIRRKIIDGIEAILSDGPSTEEALPAETHAHGINAKLPAGAVDDDDPRGWTDDIPHPGF